MFNEMANQGIISFLGIKLVDISPCLKTVSFEMPLDQSHMTITGLPHGGSLVTLADTAFGLGAWMCKPESSHRVAVSDINTSFLAPAKAGQTLVVTAKQLHSGTLSQVWHADITEKESNKAVAVLRATVLNIQSKDDSGKISALSQKINQMIEGEKILENKRNIGFNFNVKNQSKSDIAAKFDKHSANWDHYIRLSKYNVWGWIQQQCHNYARKHESITILDLGTGPGLIGKFLKENGVEGTLTGLDLSPQMLSKALSTGIYARCFVHDLDTKLPFVEKFDLITCFAVAEMLKDLCSFLNQLKVSLNPNGEIWMSVQFSRGDGFNPLEHQGMQQFTEAEFNSIASANGLKVVNSQVIEAYQMPTKDGDWVQIPYLMASLVHK